jgi:tetratricopeptide (TPR) repeat protein/NAD-dependent SIR2 family protein deacetylase
MAKQKSDPLYHLELELQEHLLERELALFCGAGISKNSGLPLANELKRRILETLLQTKQDVKQAMGVRCPFEAFMQSVYDPRLLSDKKLNAAKILELFSRGEPNSNHVLIARLAKCGSLKTVVTTNFDVLIERALKNEGLKDEVDFKRYFTEEHFATWAPNESHGIFSLFKLHGSIDNPESVRATLAAVSSRSLSEKRIGVIRYLFSTGGHKVVLVLGYSCSDAFDIVPHIQSIERSNKQVFFIEHAPLFRAIGKISRKRERNPFRCFPGKWIECNTDAFIKGLWVTLEDSIGKYELLKSESDWSFDADQWLGESKNNPIAKSFIAGVILGIIPLYDKARFYYGRALDLATEENDLEAMMGCNFEMGTIFWRWRDSANKTIPANGRKAVQHYREALRLAELLHYDSLAADCYHGLAVSHKSLGEFDIAKDCLKQSRELYRRSHHGKALAQRLSGSYGALGDIYLDERKPQEALKCFKRSFELHKGENNRQGISPFCLNMGTAYLRSRKFSQAISCYKRAERESEQKGDIYTLNAVYDSLAKAYQASGNAEMADVYKNKLDHNTGLWKIFA